MLKAPPEKHIAEYDLVIRNITIATSADMVKDDIGSPAGRVAAPEGSVWTSSKENDATA